MYLPCHEDGLNELHASSDPWEGTVLLSVDKDGEAGAKDDNGVKKGAEKDDDDGTTPTKLTCEGPRQAQAPPPWSTASPPPAAQGDGFYAGHLDPVEAAEEHREPSKTGDKLASDCSPPDEWSAEVGSDQPDAGDRPGSDETGEETAETEGENCEAEDYCAEVVACGEVQSVAQRVYLLIFFLEHGRRFQIGSAVLTGYNSVSHNCQPWQHYMECEWFSFYVTFMVINQIFVYALCKERIKDQQTNE